MPPPYNETGWMCGCSILTAKRAMVILPCDDHVGQLHVKVTRRDLVGVVEACKFCGQPEKEKDQPVKADPRKVERWEGLG